MTGILQGVLASVSGAGGAAPVNTVIPAISGTASFGQTLSSSTGTWTGTAPITYAYQWQRNTSNISGATSSSYTIQNADIGNTLRCVVTATNSFGSASANSASTATVTITIGSSYEGGYYAGEISTSGNDVATHRLVVAPVSSGQSNKQYKTTATSTAGTGSDIDGPTNSSNMDNASHPAAQFCEGLSIGGYTDWYMPAKNELEICYYNLKPTTTSNSGGPYAGGVNPNAVPSRSSTYTSGTPAQTSASAFQTGNSEAFTDIFYWSSTEYQINLVTAWGQQFSNGQQYNDVKNASQLVRAVRRVAI